MAALLVCQCDLDQNLDTLRCESRQCNVCLGPKLNLEVELIVNAFSNAHFLHRVKYSSLASVKVHVLVITSPVRFLVLLLGSRCGDRRFFTFSDHSVLKLLELRLSMQPCRTRPTTLYGPLATECGCT